MEEEGEERASAHSTFSVFTERVTDKLPIFIEFN